jgi:hypothetical protein
MAEAPIKTELIVRGRVARRPISLRGTVSSASGKNGSGAALEELSGSLELDSSLSSLLRDLEGQHRGATAALRQLLGESDVVVDRLAVSYRSGDPKRVQLALLVRVGESTWQLTLLYETGAQQADAFLVGLELSSDRKPFAENMLSGLLGEIALGNLSLYYANDELRDVAFRGSDAFQPAHVLSFDSPLPKLRSFAKGLNVDGDLLVGGVSLREALAKKTAEKKSEPAATATTPAASTPARAVPAPPAKDALDQGTETSWFEVDKSIGPLTIRRVGLSYQARRVGFKLDAALAFSVLKVTLEGLGLTYPLDGLTTDPKKIWENVRFQLDGASVSLTLGPVAITGGLIKVPVAGDDKALRLDGSLRVQTPFFGLSALGSYQQMSGGPSLFVFAALHRTLGGPPCFVVTGVALGFGINRALKLPTIDEVQDFPLLRAAREPEYLGKDLDLRKISEKLSKYIPVQEGNFWLAAGLTFTSFGQVDSAALMSVSFGTQLEIALIGVSDIRVPRQLPGSSLTLARVELAFKAALTFESGLLSLEARLTESSFVLREDFKLRGGAAFYTWFAGEHEGDFVITVGGYHPKFIVPRHYPKPDLVSFSCTMGEVALEGSCYFALCPSAIMAGGRLSIVYQSSWVRAWFIAHADFLMQWKPLYYDASIGITVGVALRFELGALRVDFSLELGASVHLCGPPFGGEARISLWIATVTVRFGEPEQPPMPLLWDSAKSEEDSFVKSFLPHTHEGCQPLTLQVSDGLLQQRGHVAQVSAHKLSLTARSVIPATDIRFNQAAPRDQAAQTLSVPDVALGVRPLGLGKEDFGAIIEIEVSSDAGSLSSAELAKRFACRLTQKSLPKALWGAAPLDRRTPAGEQMVDGATVGLEVFARPTRPSHELPAYELSLLSYEPEGGPVAWPRLKPADALSAADAAPSIADTIMRADVVRARSAVLGLLHSQQNTLKPESVRLTELAARAKYLFQDTPARARVGQPPARDMRGVG